MVHNAMEISIAQSNGLGENSKKGLRGLEQHDDSVDEDQGLKKK